MDDLAQLVHGNDKRLDIVEDTTQAQQRDISDLKAEALANREARRSKRADIIAYLALAAAYGAVIASFIHH